MSSQPVRGEPRSQPPLAYLDTPQGVSDFIGSIAGVPLLALDTEGASFHRYVDRIYLLQVSTRERSAIIDPLVMDAPPGLGDLLESPAVEVIFHDADYDLRLLHQDYGWHVRKIFDTRIAAQLLGLRAFGLAALLERYFGLRLDKKHQRADWSLRPLPTDMLEYAAQDTRHLIDLRDRMRAALEAAGRWDWAAEEFERLEGTRWAVEEEATAFLRMKGARDLSRRELAVLRELVQWRETVARELDRATFRIMSNEVLLEIARTATPSRATLGAIRGMPKGLFERRGGELIAAAERGRAIPESDLPRFPRAPRYDRDPEFDENVAKLRAVRDAAAARLGLDPGVLCSRDRLETIARLRPRSLAQLADVKDLRRWQIGQIGSELVAALGGDAADQSPYAE
jgi:ribonuclease D